MPYRNKGFWHFWENVFYYMNWGLTLQELCLATATLPFPATRALDIDGSRRLRKLLRGREARSSAK